jgi:hypothetical protein
MSTLSITVRTAQSLALYLLMMSAVFVYEHSPSAAKGRKTYGSCANLQRYLNDTNTASQQYRGFENSKLNQVYYNDKDYMIFCNGGTVIDGEDKLVCLGYIGYSWSGNSYTSHHYGHWGWTNGFRHEGSIKQNCRRM